MILYNSVNSIFSLIPQRIFCIKSKCQRNKVSKALCHVRNFTYLGAAKLERNKISNVTKVAIKKREHNFFRRNLSHNRCFFQFGDWETHRIHTRETRQQWQGFQLWKHTRLSFLRLSLWQRMPWGDKYTCGEFQTKAKSRVARCRHGWAWVERICRKGYRLQERQLMYMYVEQKYFLQS